MTHRFRNGQSIKEAIIESRNISIATRILISIGHRLCSQSLLHSPSQSQQSKSYCKIQHHYSFPRSVFIHHLKGFAWLLYVRVEIWYKKHQLRKVLDFPAFVLCCNCTIGTVCTVRAIGKWLWCKRSFFDVHAIRVLPHIHVFPVAETKDFIKCTGKK